MSCSSYEISCLSRARNRLIFHSLNCSSSHRRTDNIDPPNRHSSTPCAKTYNPPLLDSSKTKFTSTLTEPCWQSNLRSRQSFVSSRTRIICKALRKVMSRLSRDSLPNYSPPAYAAQAYATEEYAYMAPAELSGDREPCELPAHVVPGLYQQMYRYNDAESPATPIDAVAWQRHHLPHGASGDSTNVGRIFNTSRTPSRAHHVSPNMDHGHNYRTIDVAGTTLPSPPPTISPSPCQSSSSTSTSPTGSVLSGIRHFHTARCATHGTQPANDPLQHESRLHNSHYNMYPRSHYSYDHTVSPLSPITRQDDNFVLADYDQLATATTYSHHHSSLDSEGSGQLPYLSNAQQNLTAFHGFHNGQSDPPNGLFRFAQRRLYASEQYINGLSPHTSFNPHYSESQLQRTIFSPSFDFDEALPSYEASRSVPIHVEDQMAQEVQVNPRPHYRQREINQAAATAARAIVNLPPLTCVLCDVQFNGKYQKSNFRRHINFSHVGTNLSHAGIEDGKSCRVCRQRFRRPDARRKHEWERHSIEDCRPNKRRVEERGT